MADQSTPKPASERVYFVYEVAASEDSTPSSLSLVAAVEARTEKEARWAAIDSDSALKARATPQDGREAEGVSLVAIAARAVGEAILTREELNVRTVRR